jgi:hypothetical protein
VADENRPRYSYLLGNSFSTVFNYFSGPYSRMSMVLNFKFA